METLRFSKDPVVAEQEMRAVIYYLTAFGFVDGDFDARERGFIRDFVRGLVESRADQAMSLSPDFRAEIVARWTRHFDEVLEEITRDIASHTSESVAEGESSEGFVRLRVKLRCFELFKRFDDASRKRLLQAGDALIEADGVAHPNEVAFRDELLGLLDAPTELEGHEIVPLGAGTVLLKPSQRLALTANNHEFLRGGEWDYAKDPETFARQAERDIKLANRVIAKLDAMREKGQGRLSGQREFSAFSGEPPFLDGHVHVLQPADGRDYELVVIGDLHGCYSCLKAALLQSDFLGKAERHNSDPKNNPATKLVLLGDYIDRGKFSYNGVLRAVMQLFLVVPDDVYLLRGNHEYYIEHRGKVLAPVRPAEAMASLDGRAAHEVFATFMRLFEKLPNSLVFDRTLFVHAGIPREDTLAEKWVGIESLNDPDLRFQMLWSDPSDTDEVPLDLQMASARFPFGRRQFARFMSRMGLTTMVRGHERVTEGFKIIYDTPEARLMSLFSAGGKTNQDLPPTSNYREVSPMALTVRYRDGVSEVTPFAIEYERFNDPKYNNFFRDALPESQ